MEVQYMSYAKGFGLPDLNAYVDASDPDKQIDMLKRAGFTTLVNNAGPLQKINAARTVYPEMSEADYSLFGESFSERTALADYTKEPPSDAVAGLVIANGADYFSEVIVLSRPNITESLVVGIIKNSLGTNRFMICQWSYGEKLTTISDLRKKSRQHFFTKRDSKKPIKQKQPRKRRSYGSVVKSFWFGGVTIVAACLALLAFVVTNSGWVLLGVMAIVMTLCGVYVYKRSGYYDDASRVTVGCLIAAASVLSIVLASIHLDHWNTADSTENVLVCGAHQANGNSGPWIIETSAGERTLDSGFFDAKYYSNSSEIASKALVGSWVDITEHGHMSSNGYPAPFVTKATTLRPGNCG